MASSTDAERLLAQTQRERNVRGTLKMRIKQHAQKEREFAEWEDRLVDKQQRIEENIVNCDDMLRQADAKREHAEDNAKRDAMATENIFVKCTSRSHVARCATGREHANDTSVRLSIIRHFLCDMREIVHETTCDR
jgi:hypothetical protein